MISLRRLWFGIVIALFVVISSAPTYAAGETTLKIAIVDFSEIRHNAAAIKGMNAQIEGYISAYQKDLEREEQDLRQAQGELDRKRTILAPDAYAEERKKWEKSVADAQRRFLQRRQTMDGARAEAWSKINQILESVIKDVATERSFDLVLRRDQVVFATPALDITEEVLRRLDRQLPTVEVTIPGG